MKLSDVPNHIGATVTMNGKGDLAIDGRFREYIWPEPEKPYLFTIVKVTRGGLVQLRDECGRLLEPLKARNIDLVEVKSE
jgi:hypothetical protein